MEIKGFRVQLSMIVDTYSQINIVLRGILQIFILQEPKATKK